eukprot:30341-Amphidinium_carterae.1
MMMMSNRAGTALSCKHSLLHTSYASSSSRGGSSASNSFSSGKPVLHSAIIVFSKSSTRGQGYAPTERCWHKCSSCSCSVTPNKFVATTHELLALALTGIPTRLIKTVLAPKAHARAL